MSPTVAAFGPHCSICYNPGHNGVQHPERCPMASGATTGGGTPSDRNEVAEFSADLTLHPDYSQAMDPPELLGEGDSEDFVELELDVGFGPGELDQDWDTEVLWAGEVA